ncbi:MAG TPA: AMP-binding protein [Bryobacteraceae bacterium]|nr:AMP-binding protein [Bryobacteraceae bacterium]
MIGDPPSLAAFFDAWQKNPGEFLRYEGDLGIGHASYSDAAEAARNFAGHLSASNIQKGDRIVFWGENRPEWVIALWGCLLSGVVAVPVDFRSSAAVVEHIAAIVEARAVLIGPGLNAPANLPSPVWPMHLVFDAPHATPAIVPAGLGDMAEVLFTSGATGDPKGVTITHRNILANLKPIDEGVNKYRKYMGPFKPIRFLNLLPLSHMFGQSMAAFIPAIVEGDVFFTSGYTPRDILRLIHRRRISVLVCVPQMLGLLRTEIENAFPESKEPRRGAKWYAGWWQYRRVHRRFGWKVWAFVVGAAPLDPDLEEFWRKLGFVVIQGYGLTETAPVATLNHPFNTRKGSVGKPISGVEVRIAPDGEVLVRGENVTPGYYGASASEGNAMLDAEGWLHTGDIGELDAENRLRILGRKKEMIVAPSGLNVFPEDVERVLNTTPGVRDSAVVAARSSAGEQVHAVLVLDPGVSVYTVISQANSKLEMHQRVRGFSIWPSAELPRTSGTNKLKRTEIAGWVAGKKPAGSGAAGTAEEILQRYAGTRQIGPETSLDDLGLSSLDRIQLSMELEQATGRRVDERARTAGELIHPAASMPPPDDEADDFPEWNRAWPSRLVRHISLPLLILPLTRAFAWLKVEGRENLQGLRPPVIFAANHQSYLDVPAILYALPRKWRYRIAPAMAKEFFAAHFHPQGHSVMDRFTSGLNYFLAALVFNAFPLPQREAGTRVALRYAGELASDGYSIVIFPEGRRTDAGEIQPFQAGVGMLAARLGIPVVPVRLEGLDRILHKSAKMATPGRARVKFGPPLYLEGSDYPALARHIEEAVRNL